MEGGGATVFRRDLSLSKPLLLTGERAGGRGRPEAPGLSAGPADPAPTISARTAQPISPPPAAGAPPPALPPEARGRIPGRDLPPPRPRPRLARREGRRLRSGHQVRAAAAADDALPRWLPRGRGRAGRSPHAHCRAHRLSLPGCPAPRRLRPPTPRYQPSPGSPGPRPESAARRLPEAARGPPRGRSRSPPPGLGLR